MPEVSIIVPVYKVEKYIERCVESILNQTFMDFELILVDDGSPDKSGDICDRYARVDRRIKVVHQQNGGLADARNAGLDLAQGNFIGFVDSDDYIESDMYAKLLDACMTYDADISMCGRYDVYQEQRVPLFSFEGTAVWSSKEAIENLLTWQNIDSSACDKLFSRQLFRNMRFPVGRYNEDIFIMARVLFSANQIVHIGESKYNYCHRSSSITTETFSEKKMDLLDASQILMDFVSEKYPNMRTKAESFHYKGIIYLLCSLQSKEIQKRHHKSFHVLRKLLLQNIYSILTNPYLDSRQKLSSVLLATNTFGILRGLWHLINTGLPATT